LATEDSDEEEILSTEPVAATYEGIYVFSQKTEKRHGPYTMMQLQKLVDQGYFTPHDLAIYQGLEQWVTLEHVPDIRFPVVEAPAEPEAESEPVAEEILAPEEDAPALTTELVEDAESDQQQAETSGKKNLAGSLFRVVAMVCAFLILFLYLCDILNQHMGWNIPIGLGLAGIETVPTRVNAPNPEVAEIGDTDAGKGAAEETEAPETVQPPPQPAIPAQPVEPPRTEPEPPIANPVPESNAQAGSEGKLGTLLWQFETGGEVSSSPAIGSDGTVYVGSSTNKLYAIHGKSGVKLWEFETGANVSSSPAIGSDGTVYVGSHDNKLYAINGKSGLKLWEFETRGWLGSPTIGSDGTVYVGSHDKKLYAINGKSGLKLWEFETRGWLYSPTAIGSDGTVYVGSWDNKLYAVNGKSGVKLWEFETGDGVTSSPAIGSDGTVYVGSDDNKLYAINGKSGDKLWEFETGDSFLGVRSSPAIGSDGTVYVGSADKKVYALRGSSGPATDAPWPMRGQNVRHTGRAKKTSTGAGPSRPNPTPAPAPDVQTSGKAFTIPDLSLDMLWVKPGTFEMGDSDKTRHTVTLTEGYWLGKYEVTQAQWGRVMGNNPSRFKGVDRPVELVKWTDVTSFCEKLTELEREAGRLPAGMAYQLPTEAQWEYACRAGTKTAFSFGDELTPKQANFDENVGETTDVGKYPANAWGFHDMHGNIWEWCADWHGKYPTSAVSAPLGPVVGSDRVHRGGSWYRTASIARSAFRQRDVPAVSFFDLGVRLSLRPASKAEPQVQPFASPTVETKPPANQTPPPPEINPGDPIAELKPPPTQPEPQPPQSVEPPTVEIKPPAAQILPPPVQAANLPDIVFSAEPFRTFHTTQGHSMVGRLIGYQGQTTFIEDQAGRRYQLDFRQLSQADGQYCIDAVKQRRIPTGVPPSQPVEPPTVAIKPPTVQIPPTPVQAANLPEIDLKVSIQATSATKTNGVLSKNLTITGKPQDMFDGNYETFLSTPPLTGSDSFMGNVTLVFNSTYRVAGNDLNITYQITTETVRRVVEVLHRSQTGSFAWKILGALPQGSQKQTASLKVSPNELIGGVRIYCGGRKGFREYLRIFEITAENWVEAEPRIKPVLPFVARSPVRREVVKTKDKEVDRPSIDVDESIKATSTAKINDVVFKKLAISGNPRDVFDGNDETYLSTPPLAGSNVHIGYVTLMFNSDYRVKGGELNVTYSVSEASGGRGFEVYHKDKTRTFKWKTLGSLPQGGNKQTASVKISPDEVIRGMRATYGGRSSFKQYLRVYEISTDGWLEAN
jgi:outer membrane protein assembly factor BamB/formylglycine-generating enzyme required for sulfatase activity